MADLVTLQEAKDYIGKFGKDSAHDDDLAAVISGASEFIRQETGEDWDERAYTDRRNGKGSQAMRALHWPIASAPLPTASENGTALVVAVGFSETADVSVDPATGTFYRLNGPTSVVSPMRWSTPATWSRGVLNVVLGYTAGFAAGSIPADIRLICNYITARAWKEADRKEIGISSRATGQMNVSFLEDLPGRMNRIIKARQRVFTPER